MVVCGKKVKEIIVTDNQGQLIATITDDDVITLENYLVEMTED